MFLVEKPPPIAGDRPVEKYRYWPLPDKLPKAPVRREFVDPPMDDPAFALRKEEFEQWLVRRKEALEHQFAERKAELEKGFEAKVKARVEEQMKKGPFAADWEDDPRTARLKKTISDLRAKNRYSAKLFEERLEEKTGAMPRTTFTALVNCLHTDRPTLSQSRKRGGGFGPQPTHASATTS
jgi:hypothetical protein